MGLGFNQVKMMTKKKIKIREDLVKILEEEGPLTSATLVEKLEEMNPRRRTNSTSVGQILRSKQFCKAGYVTVGRGDMWHQATLWKLKEE